MSKKTKDENGQCRLDTKNPYKSLRNRKNRITNIT